MIANVERLLDGPIIDAGLSERIGDNINGASLIRVPDWVESPLGRYYLYFAHHKGRFIRMAYSDDLLGPWVVHEPGVLDVANSYFVAEDLEGLDESSEGWVSEFGGVDTYAHVASPDIHVDENEKTIRMYYHGLLENGSQQTRIATSVNGLDFIAHEPLLGPCYFRVFEYEQYVYAIAWGGELLRSKNWVTPFEPGPNLIKNLAGDNAIMRHVAVRRREDKLDLFYSCIGDFPEAIRHSVISLGSDWNDWRAQKPKVILAPEREWEGGLLEKVRSNVGAAEGPEHGLRDPCVFEEEGRCYLLYCGAGESAIGIAEIHFQ